MNIFGKRLSEYVAFSMPLVVLILVVGIGRLALSLAGLPNSEVKWLSITVVMWIGVFYYAVRIHTSGFGSYKHLLPICSLSFQESSWQSSPAMTTSTARRSTVSGPTARPGCMWRPIWDWERPSVLWWVGSLGV